MGCFHTGLRVTGGKQGTRHRAGEQDAVTAAGDAAQTPLQETVLAGPAQRAAGTHLEITSKGQNAGGGFRPDGDPAPTGFLSVSPSRGVGTWRGVRGAERCPWQVVRGEDLSARGGGAAPQAQIRGSLPDP